MDASEELGIRWLSFDRPGYGGSSSVESWRAADAAAVTRHVADAAGAEQFAVVGHSGGGPHALACAALLGDRVAAAVSISGLAPYNAADLDWYGGMHEGGVAELRAAATGSDALKAFLKDMVDDPAMFTESDIEALEGAWSSFGLVAAAGVAGGLAGVVSDNVAYVSDWGFSLESITAPTLIVHGTDDRIVPVSHGHWLSQHLPHSELWVRPGDGHLSVMDAGFDVLDWLVAHAWTAA